MTLKEKSKALKQQQFDLCNEVNVRLKNAEKLADLNAFVRLRSDQAQKKAEEVQSRVKQGKPVGSLSGTIIAIKDNINISNEYSTCGSKILESFRSASRLGSTRPVAVSQKAGMKPAVRFSLLTPPVPP